MESQKVKFKANCNKNWAKLIKYVSCTSRISKPNNILKARGSKLKKKCKFIHEKSDSKECKAKLECRKVKCGANLSTIWANSPKYASCTSGR